MLKSHSRFNSFLIQSLQLIGLLGICFTTLANYAQGTELDWSSVVKITFKNPESGLTTNCSGVLIGPSTAITSASCLLTEETGKQTLSARVCADRTANKLCLNSREIMTHSGYQTAQSFNNANNLAYIILKGQFNLVANQIKIFQEITPSEFQDITNEQKGLTTTYWVAYNQRGVSSVAKNDFRGVIAPLEFNYAKQNLIYNGHTLKLGSHFAGAPVFVELAGELKILGLLSGLRPDSTVHYYPEVNPCDNDPVIVRYPKEIMRYHADISAYAVSACGMQGFQIASAYSALNCKRMQGALSLEVNLNQDNPIALRQRAEILAKGDTAREQIIQIYQHLNKAIAAGDIKAREMLAEILLEGELLPKDLESAKTLLKGESGQLISSYAHLLTARELLRGYNDEDFRSLNPEIDKTLYFHLSNAANEGYSEAQYYLGRMHQFGVATKPDNRKAYEWLAKAAMQGHSIAQFQIGTMWIDGRGVRSYPEVGLYWVRQSAARGYSKANNYLALNKGQYKIDSALNEYEMEYNDTE